MKIKQQRCTPFVKQCAMYVNSYKLNQIQIYFNIMQVLKSIPNGTKTSMF